MIDVFTCIIIIVSSDNDKKAHEVAALYHHACFRIQTNSKIHTIVNQLKKLCSNTHFSSNAVSVVYQKHHTDIGFSLHLLVNCLLQLRQCKQTNTIIFHAHAQS